MYNKYLYLRLKQFHFLASFSLSHATLLNKTLLLLILFLSRLLSFSVVFILSFAFFLISSVTRCIIHSRFALHTRCSFFFLLSFGAFSVAAPKERFLRTMMRTYVVCFLVQRAASSLFYFIFLAFRDGSCLPTGEIEARVHHARLCQERFKIRSKTYICALVYSRNAFLELK